MSQTRANWHGLKSKNVVNLLKTNVSGLKYHEAEKRIQQYGPNKLVRLDKVSPWKILIQQFLSFLVILLIFAALFSFLIGEMIDASVIAVILILNAVLGFVQEYRAEKAMEALERMASPKALVVREGKVREVDAELLVPGDIILLHEGDKVPADCYIIESFNASASEAALTGESTPVEKKVGVAKDKPLAERSNMLYMATILARGKAKAVVVNTGMSTEVGKIAKLIQASGPETSPLKQRMEVLGKRLGIAIIVITAAIIPLGMLRNVPMSEIILTAISLAVSAVPEGLPAVVTVTLALGMQRMAKKKALVRKLAAVEALGSASVICADKTGTMTTNEMTVREIYDNSKAIKITGVGWEPKGKFSHKPPIRLMQCAVLCNNAHLHHDNNQWTIIGDPTEAALLSMAAKAGFRKHELAEKMPEISEVPFSSERKLMSTLNQKGRRFVMCSKGAPEILLEKCDTILVNNTITKLTAVKKRQILEQNKKMASNGLRVLGFAYKDVVSKPKTFDIHMEKKLTFIGLAGMIDPPRPEVKQSIVLCRTAGIQVKMITGDHALTAKVVARELGIYQNKDRIVTGAELSEMSEKELEKIVEKVSVFARVSPDHKVRIVKALQKKGHTVAMTGDGVNDAPALKIADIGVAMGIKGTDVSKESADMILRDDNFSTIVAAVKEGRAIYDNIRKFVRFLLSANFDEIAVIAIATIAGWPLPFLPVQILWINLATDGLPALALGKDPAEPDIMRKKPRPKHETVLHNMGPIILVTSALAVIAALLIFNTELMVGSDLTRARTMVLTTAIMFELFRVFSCRIDEHKSIWPKLRDFTANKMLLVAVAISFLMHLTVLYFPPLQAAFSTVPLGLNDWFIVILMASMAFLVHPLTYHSRKFTKKK